MNTAGCVQRMVLLHSPYVATALPIKQPANTHHDAGLTSKFAPTAPGGPPAWIFQAAASRTGPDFHGDPGVIPASYNSMVRVVCIQRDQKKPVFEICLEKIQKRILDSMTSAARLFAHCSSARTIGGQNKNSLLPLPSLLPTSIPLTP